MSDPTGMHFGPYLLRRRLGVGGMASVWTAIDAAGNPLVVKRILPMLAEDPEFVAMFVREAELSARLRHPNIVRVHDHGDYEGERYLAMEYVHGQDLGAVMQALAPRGVPSASIGAFVAQKVARALAYVHALTDDAGAPLHLVHRDVSLANVMVGYDGAVKLLDFGVAKALARERSGRTQAGVIKGKWSYLSPEQVEGGEVDQRTDLFSLGIVLHEMLTARRLFKAATGLETLERVRAACVPAPSTMNPDVPRELDAICVKALARRPGDRFASAAELADALDRVVARRRFGAPELALTMRSLFPVAAATAREAARPTPVPGTLPAFDDDPTRLSPRGVRLSALRRRRRSPLWRVALWATLALGAGGLTGWRLARARVGRRAAVLRPVHPLQVAAANRRGG